VHYFEYIKDLTYGEAEERNVAISLFKVKLPDSNGDLSVYMMFSPWCKKSKHVVDIFFGMWPTI